MYRDLVNLIFAIGIYVMVMVESVVKSQLIYVNPMEFSNQEMFRGSLPQHWDPDSLWRFPKPGLTLLYL